MADTLRNQPGIGAYGRLCLADLLNYAADSGMCHLVKTILVTVPDFFIITTSPSAGSLMRMPWRL